MGTKKEEQGQAKSNEAISLGTDTSPKSKAPEIGKEKLRELKDPKDIDVIKTKSTYRVPIYKVTNNGLEIAGDTEVKFCKGNKSDDTVFRQEGFFTETLLNVIIQYLKDNNIGDLENDYTSAAIAHLETAQIKLDQRAADRKAGSVQGTYNK